MEDGQLYLCQNLVVGVASFVLVEADSTDTLRSREQCGSPKKLRQSIASALLLIRL